VIFDVGHGGGSFLFRQAVPAMQQGFGPDSISTDLHIGSMNGAMQTMLTTMSKFLNMGMTLDDVILRSTWNPAQEIKRTELGHLSVGAPADIAVLSLHKGDFGFVDVNGARMRGTQKLEGELTARDGKVVWDMNGLSRSDWKGLGKYGAQGDPKWDGIVRSENRTRR
jgi:dihydroorotase